MEGRERLFPTTGDRLSVSRNLPCARLFQGGNYLDLRRMPAPKRAKQGPELAAQLEDLLDDTLFDITVLSRDPEGDTVDGLSANREHLGWSCTDCSDSRA
jgi:hypothetical protein